MLWGLESKRLKEHAQPDIPLEGRTCKVRPSLRLSFDGLRVAPDRSRVNARAMKYLEKGCQNSNFEAQRLLWIECRLAGMRQAPGFEPAESG
jgi:hypothetical protein